MSMIINNPTAAALAVQDVTVTWNYLAGRNGGNGKLELQNSALNSAIYWSGKVTAASFTITPSPSISIPTGSSTISFKFKFSYDIRNGTERIYINISTPGCVAIDSNN